MKGVLHEKLLVARNHQIAEKDGWYEVHCVGDHHQFKHPTKKGRVTVTHPRRDFPLDTLKSIAEQAGIDLP